MDTVHHYLYLVPSETTPIVHVLLEPQESTPEFYHFATFTSVPCTDECTHLLFSQTVVSMLKQLSLETQNKYWNQSKSAIGNVAITHISEEIRNDNDTGS